MKNEWTGAQYSLFRALLGLYLLVRFLALLPRGAEALSSRGALSAPAGPVLHVLRRALAIDGAPWLAAGLLAFGAAASLCFAVGLHDRVAAVALCCLWAFLGGDDPLVPSLGLPPIGWILLAHPFLPRAPYGSFARRGLADPGASWRKPEGFQLAAWILLAAGYGLAGYAGLAVPSWANGLQLLFAPLALVRRLRPALWSALLLTHLWRVALVGLAGSSLDLAMLHLYAFDPGWIPRRSARRVETLFYDGHCGLCHRLLRFVLSEDRGGAAFRFAPLGGEAFRSEVPEERRAALPDSVVVLRDDGALLVRSEAVRRVLTRLGGVWRLVGEMARIVPPPVLDAAYDVVARRRRRLFAPVADACPVLPEELRPRFDR
jgi:predicted DCC family thiol-disulfide oxidoreductase YuxK